MGFPKGKEPFALCRCGIVERTLFFEMGESEEIRIGLKIMTKAQLIAQRDDIENELRIMAALQPAGLFQDRY